MIHNYHGMIHNYDVISIYKNHIQNNYGMIHKSQNHPRNHGPWPLAHLRSIVAAHGLQQCGLELELESGRRPRAILGETYGDYRIIHCMVRVLP